MLGERCRHSLSLLVWCMMEVLTSWAFYAELHWLALAFFPTQVAFYARHSAGRSGQLLGTEAPQSPAAFSSCSLLLKTHPSNFRVVANAVMNGSILACAM